VAFMRFSVDVLVGQANDRSFSEIHRMLPCRPLVKNERSPC